MPTITNSALAKDRVVLRVSGGDAESFLQGLLTNDVAGAEAQRGVYAALLTPQGKFLADMILWRPEQDRFLLDADAALAGDLQKRLTMYKLRAAVDIAVEETLAVLLCWAEDGGVVAEAETPADAVAGGPDPRDARLGLRVIMDKAALAPAAEPAASPDGLSGALEDWDSRRIALGVPAAGLDLRPNDAFPLEYGFERLNGVDFKKGCFVGQEVVARMKHKAELKKGLFHLAFDGPTPAAGSEVLAGEKTAGSIGSAREGRGLALLRLDRAAAVSSVGEARVTEARRVEG